MYRYVAATPILLLGYAIHLGAAAQDLNLTQQQCEDLCAKHAASGATRRLTTKEAGLVALCPKRLGDALDKSEPWINPMFSKDREIQRDVQIAAGHREQEEKRTEACISILKSKGDKK